MSVSSTVSRDIETLEAELRLALSNESLSPSQRAELEGRLLAIKAKAERNAASFRNG